MNAFTFEQALQSAVAHHQAGELAQAEVIYRQVLAAQPLNPDALRLLGVIAQQVGHHEAAVDLISRAIAERSDEAPYYASLGEAYGDLRRLDEAADCYRRALALRPDLTECHNNLGNVFKDQGKIDEAIACYQRALTLRPDLTECHNNLALAMAEKGQLVEAVDYYQQALALRPDFAEAYNNLGNVFKDQGKLDEALQAYRQALELQPALSGAHCNHGNILKDQGRLDEALESYKRAMALAPDNPALHSNFLLMLNLQPGLDTQTIFEECRLWDRYHGQPRRIFTRPHHNDPAPERRLKVGYVSPNLCHHPVGRFLLPLLENHDREHFEITCYAEVARPDSLTKRLRAQVERWRDTCGSTEEQLAEQVREDGIDVLVDLALHSAGNRLPVFARKPAPVQISFAGYPDTTGLEAIKYRLSDAFLNPIGYDTPYSSEEVIRLADSFWLYAAPEGGPDINPLPVLDSRHVTFGCLNNFCKVNGQVLALWARVLDAVPGSRLLLLTAEGSHRERIQETLRRLGIDAERLDFAARCSSLEYLALHHQVDIILDTFPYNGHTTSLDALWMGVPVVSLVGQTEVSRGGLSILSNIGLPELAARTEDEYVKVAVELANDLPRLAHLRETMRERMQASPLMDAPRFAKNIEHAYRTMWRTWCEEKTAGSVPSL